MLRKTIKEQNLIDKFDWGAAHFWTLAGRRRSSAFQTKIQFNELLHIQRPRPSLNIRDELRYRGIVYFGETIFEKGYTSVLFGGRGKSISKSKEADN